MVRYIPLLVQLWEKHYFYFLEILEVNERKLQVVYGFYQRTKETILRNRHISPEQNGMVLASYEKSQDNDFVPPTILSLSLT